MIGVVYGAMLNSTGQWYIGSTFKSLKCRRYYHYAKAFDGSQGLELRKTIGYGESTKRWKMSQKGSYGPWKALTSAPLVALPPGSIPS